MLIRVWLVGLLAIASAGCDRREAAPVADAGPDFALVQQIIATQLGIPSGELQASKSFHDLGADALGIVEITMEVEDRLDITINDDAINRAAGTSELEDLPKRLKVSDFAHVVTQSRNKP